MKYYPQAFLFAGVLLISIIISTPQSPAEQTAFINEPISASSLALDAPSAPLNEHFLPKPPPPINLAPPLTTSSALAKMTSGNEVFYELNPEQRWPLASLTKLMTATVALENTASTPQRAAIIKRMMIISDNTAADGIASQFEEKKFVNLMNEKAAILGMTNTGFSDASGLSYLNQSTVRDLDILVTYILERHPEIFQWSREKSVVIDGQTYTNINKFVNRNDFLGGKTGFTDEADGNLISLFTTKNGPVTIIVLGAPGKIERFAQTEKLFKWISQHFKL